MCPPLAAQNLALAAKSKTVILVRHAEKTAEPKDDPVLSPAGEARANALAQMLSKSGVTALFATEFKRTQLTLKPLADARHLKVHVVPGNDTAGLVKKIQSELGGVIVVAGHSNTVDKIIEALGAGKIAVIDDAEYDNLYVLTMPANGPPSVLTLKYGQPTPPSGKPAMTPMKP